MSKRIPAARCRELDELAEQLRADLNGDERRYLIEQLKGGDDLARWRADVERIGRKPTALAQLWGITRDGAQRRLRKLDACSPIEPRTRPLRYGPYGPQ
jgi:hypothetical protein